MLAACTLALTACGGGDESEPEVFCSVTYSIGGFGISKAAITYDNSSGGTSQTEQAIPYTIGPFVKSKGDFLYVSAQNKSSSGFVSVAIKIGSATVKSAQSSVPYGIATATATASGSCS